MYFKCKMFTVQGVYLNKKNTLCKSLDPKWMGGGGCTPNFTVYTIVHICHRTHSVPVFGNTPSLVSCNNGLHGSHLLLWLQECSCVFLLSYQKKVVCMLSVLPLLTPDVYSLFRCLVRQRSSCLVSSESSWNPALRLTSSSIHLPRLSPLLTQRYVYCLS